MKLKVNSKEVETEACHLLQLARELGLPAQGVALAVDRRMVPRTEWENCVLTDGMDIIVVKAVCGG